MFHVAPLGCLPISFTQNFIIVTQLETAFHVILCIGRVQCPSPLKIWWQWFKTWCWFGSFSWKKSFVHPGVRPVPLVVVSSRFPITKHLIIEWSKRIFHELAGYCFLLKFLWLVQNNMQQHAWILHEQDGCIQKLSGRSPARQQSNIVVSAPF